MILRLWCHIADFFEYTVPEVFGHAVCFFKGHNFDCGAAYEASNCTRCYTYNPAPCKFSNGGFGVRCITHDCWRDRCVSEGRSTQEEVIRQLSAS